jgi:hypothetical protein
MRDASANSTSASFASASARGRVRAREIDPVGHIGPDHQSLGAEALFSRLDLTNLARTEMSSVTDRAAAHHGFPRHPVRLMDERSPKG